MNISEINIVPIKPKDGLLGFASFVIDRKFYVGSVAIFSRLDGGGIRLSYPKKGQIDCVHPISQKAGEIITEAIQRRFNELKETL